VALVWVIVVVALAVAVARGVAAFLLRGTQSCLAYPAPAGCSAAAQWMAAWFPFLISGSSVIAAGLVVVLYVRRCAYVSRAILVVYIVTAAINLAVAAALRF